MVCPCNACARRIPPNILLLIRAQRAKICLEIGDLKPGCEFCGVLQTPPRIGLLSGGRRRTSAAADPWGLGDAVAGSAVWTIDSLLRRFVGTASRLSLSSLCGRASCGAPFPSPIGVTSLSCGRSYDPMRSVRAYSLSD